MAQNKSIELLNKSEIGALSDEELDKYHTKLQNHRDDIRKHLIESVVAERDKRNTLDGKEVAASLTPDQRSALAQLVKAQGIESLEGVNGN